MAFVFGCLIPVIKLQSTIVVDQKIECGNNPLDNILGSLKKREYSVEKERLFKILRVGFVSFRHEVVNDR